MTAQDIKNGILQLAVQGKLVKQRPDEGTAEELYLQIQKEKQALILAGKIKKEKPLSEITEDEKPFDIPENWKWVRLDDLAIKEIKRGKSPTYSAGSGTRVFAQKCNTKLGHINLDLALYLDESTLSKYPESEFMRDKDIVINSTGDGTLGRVGIFRDKDNPDGFPVVPDSHVTIIRTNSELVDYVFYGLKYYQPYMEKLGSGSTKQTELSAGIIKNLLFPLPPLTEQQRIVAKIEELMPLVEEYGKAEERLTALNAEFPDKLRKSILQQAIQGKLTERDPADEPASELLKRIRAEKERLIREGTIKKEKPLPPITEEEMPFEIPDGWAVIRIGEVGVYKKGPFGSSITKNMFVPKGPDSVKVYEQKNAIQKDHTLGEYYIRRSYFNEKMRGFEVFPGDVIVSCAGTIGETYVMPYGIEQGIINQALMRMKIVPSLNLDYFLLYFDYVLKKSAQGSSKGSAIKNIPPFDVFKKMVLPLPPLAEQQRIVDRVNELLAVCDELK